MFDKDKYDRLNMIGRERANTALIGSNKKQRSDGRSVVHKYMQQTRKISCAATLPH